ELAGTGDRVEGPDEAAVVRVERLHAAADAVLGTREAGDHEAVVVERRARDAEAFLPAFGLHGPEHVAARLRGADERAVELPAEALAVAEADSEARPAAADHGAEVRIEVRPVIPKDLAGLDVYREDVVRARHDVERALVDDRLRLARILRADAGAPEPRAPDAFEARDVASIDLGRRRVALVVPVAAVRRPARDGRLDEHVPGERGSTLDRLLRERGAGQRCDDQRDGARKAAEDDGAAPRAHYFVPLKCSRPGLYALSSRKAFIAFSRFSAAPKFKASPSFA